MKTPLPLRDYKQMVRIVREASDCSTFTPRVPYKLGHAYGDSNCNPTEKRERTLDENGINSRTPRQPEPVSVNNYLGQRESTATISRLSTDQQVYFTGTNPNPAPTRQDGWPGTKIRAYLGAGDNTQYNAEKVVITRPTQNTSIITNPDNEAVGVCEPKTDSETLAQRGSAISHSSTPQPLSSNHSEAETVTRAPLYKKQTRLPIIKSPSIEGIKGTGLSVSSRNL